MASTQQKIDFIVGGVEKAAGGLKKLESAFKRLDSEFNKTTLSADKNNAALNKLSEQGMFNIQAGMVQMSTYSMILNQKINNAFDKMTNSFRNAENSLVQLKIKMGEGLGNTNVDAQYGMMEKRIRELAATTQFTVPEVANAFDALVGAGNSAEASIKALGPALQYVSASANQVSLAEGLETVKLTTTVLGDKIGNVGKNLNDIFVATQKTSLGFKKVYETVVGLKTSFTAFAQTDDLSRSLIALGASMASMGQVGREGGDKINQFTGALDKMFSITERGMFRGYGRKSENRKNLMRLFGLGDIEGKPIEEELRRINLAENIGIDIDKELKGLGKKAKSNKLKAIQDEILKNLLATKGKDGKYTMKSATETIDSLLKAYKKTVEREGDKSANALLASAMGGTKSAKLVMQGIIKQMEKLGANSFSEMVDKLKSKGHELSEAQKKALNTVEGQTKLLESAYDAMYQSIMSKDVFGKEALRTHRDLISTLTMMLDKYPSLAQAVSALGRSFQLFTSVATNLGFALTATATLSMGLSYAQKTTGLATKGLGATLGAFSRIFLLPTLGILIKLVGAFGFVGIGILALMKHFTGAQSIGEGFGAILSSISQKVKGFTSILKMMNSEDKAFKNLTAEQITEKYTKAQTALDDFYDRVGTKKLSAEETLELEKLTNDIGKFKAAMGGNDDDWRVFRQNTGNALMSIAKGVTYFSNLQNQIQKFISGALKPLAATMGVILVGFNAVIGLLAIPLKILQFLGSLINSIFGANVIGMFVGGLIGVVVLFKTIAGVAKLLMGYWSMITGSITKARIGLNNFNAGLEQTAKHSSYTMRDRSGLHGGNDIHFGSSRDLRRSDVFKDNLDLYRGNKKQMFKDNLQRHRHEVQLGFLSSLRFGWYKATGQAEKYDKLLGHHNEVLKQHVTTHKGLNTVEYQSERSLERRKQLTAGLVGAGLLLGQVVLQNANLSEEVASKLNIALNIMFVMVSLTQLFGISLAKIGAFLAGLLSIKVGLVVGAIAAIYYFFDEIVGFVKYLLGIKPAQGATLNPSSSTSPSTGVTGGRRPMVVNDHRKIEQTNNITTKDAQMADVVHQKLKTQGEYFTNTVDSMF